MIGAGLHGEAGVGGLRAGIVAARDVLHFFSAQTRRAEILIGWNVDHASLGAERDGRPVLAAMQRGAIFCALAGAGLVGRIDLRPAGFGIQAQEHVLLHVRLPFDELDFSARALHVAAVQKPEIAIAGNVDQSLHSAAAALVIHQDRRRDFVPIPGVVGVVLEVALDRAGGDVQRDGGGYVEVVAGSTVAHPGAAVTHAPKGQVGLGIIIARNPDRPSAVFPLIAVGPSFAAGLAGGGNGVGAPEFFA